MYSSFQPKPVKKSKKRGLGTVSPGLAQAAASYTSTNTTGNARAGQKYRTQATSNGVYHIYPSGERVFVKKKKNANPSRSYS